MNIAVKTKSGQSIVGAVLNIAAVMFVFSLPLFLFRLVFDQGNWALVSLLPFFLVIFLGCYHVILRRRRAILLASLKPDSALLSILKGRIFAAVTSFLIATLSTLILAFEVITITLPEIIVMALLCFVALSCYRLLTVRLSKHFNETFLPAVSATLSAVLSGFLLSPVYAWVELNHVTRPGYIKALSLSDSIKETLEQTTGLGGILNEVFSIFYALDTTKIWLVVNAENLQWTTTQFLVIGYVVIDAAICFLVARAVVAVAAFLQFGLSNWRY